MAPAPSDDDFEFICLGSGTSSSLPHLDCLTAPPTQKPCRTCLSTLTPEGRKNKRRNTSGVFRLRGKDGKLATVVIDTGKTFQAAALEWFPKYGLREIDAVLITHAHADAINGLDDLRGWTLRGAIQPHVDLYVSQSTYIEVQRSFPYLVSKEFASGGGDVPDFKWHIIADGVPFEINDTGIWVTPFNVHHGRVFSTAPPLGCVPTPQHPPEVILLDTPQPPNDALALAATNGSANGNANGSTNGKANGSMNGKANGQTNGQTNGKTNGLTNGTTNGATNGTANGSSTGAIQPYLCFGFKIADALVYISDTSHIPDAVWPLLATPSGPPPPSDPPSPSSDAASDASLDAPAPARTFRGGARRAPVLLLDCLHLAPHTSHFGVAEAVAAARRAGAARTFLLGFGHEVAHAEYETILRAAAGPVAPTDAMTQVERAGLELVPEGEPIRVEPAWDGMRIVVGAEGDVRVDED